MPAFGIKAASVHLLRARRATYTGKKAWHSFPLARSRRCCGRGLGDKGWNPGVLWPSRCHLFPVPSPTKIVPRLERLRLLFPTPQDPFCFHLWWCHPGDSPTSPLWEKKGRNEGRDLKKAPLSVKTSFRLSLPFSISCIRDMASLLPHPLLLRFPGNGGGLEERKHGNSHCISLHRAVVEKGFE